MMLQLSYEDLDIFPCFTISSGLHAFDCRVLISVDQYIVHTFTVSSGLHAFITSVLCMTETCTGTRYSEVKHLGATPRCNT